MTTEPRMTIKQAGIVRRRFGYKAVIIVGVRDDGGIDVMSHGDTTEDCRVIGEYAQKQFGDNLPVSPFQTWFGWGNGGVPLAIDRKVRKGSSPLAQQYMDANTHPDAVQP